MTLFLKTGRLIFVKIIFCNNVMLSKYSDIVSFYSTL